MCRKNDNIDSQNLPKYIQTTPQGIDKYEGGSQERLSSTIAKHIIDTDRLDATETLPRIIGIEGGWGTGKTNVVKLLKNKLIKNYFLFEYDAWGHQEDLQRRSIIKKLTSELLKNSILENGNKETNSLLNPDLKISWKDKLDELLCRRTIKFSKSIPNISLGAFLTALCLSATPITVFLAKQLDIKNIVNALLWQLVIAFFPIILAFVIWGVVCIKNKDARNLGYFLKLTKKEDTDTKKIETINEDEPSVELFSHWMEDVSEYISLHNKKKIIIVFDNMDRLPSSKVKDLWSSINTFFADGGFKNIWAIIPFDREHLKYAFELQPKLQPNTGGKVISDYFIDKTFPIVFRITPPLITDFKSIFNKLYIEAFKDTENKNRNIINRIFRSANPNANIREMIAYINEIVSLNREWYNENINLVNIALFVSEKEMILSNPVNQILSGEFCEKFQEFIDYNDDTRTDISALAFGVKPAYAKQVPLTKYILNCFEQDDELYDINKYSNFVAFDSTVEEIALEFRNINKLIRRLDKLSRDSDIISSIWDNIAKRKEKIDITKQELSEENKILLLHIDGSDRNHFISSLCSKIRNFKDFNGYDFFKAFSCIESFIKDNAINYTFPTETQIIDSSKFIDYVNAAGEEYKRYGLFAEKTSLEKIITEQIFNGLYHHDTLSTLKSDNNYSFKDLLTNLEDAIKKPQTITVSNVGSIFTAYKEISISKPVTFKLDTSALSTLRSGINSKADKATKLLNGYYDITAMSLISSTNMAIIDEDIEGIANVMDYYCNYGDMLVGNCSWGFSALNKISQYMILNGLGENLSLERILPHFNDIKTQTNVTEEDLLKHLNKWNNQVGTITTANIKSLILVPSLYSNTSKLKNELTNHINKTAIEAFTSINTNELYAQKQYYNTDYWLLLLQIFIDSKDIVKLPDNVVDFCKKIFLDIASDKQTLPLPEYISKIFELLELIKLKATAADIRNLVCNDKNTMTPQKFIILEKLLRTQGELKKRDSDVVNKILKPVISDENCRKMIFEHTDFYKDLISGCNGGIDEFNNSIIGLLKALPNDTKLIEFANGINIQYKEQ